MTESEWLASEDPQAMLRFATHTDYNNEWHHRKPSDRKLRLFVEAARLRWPDLVAKTDLKDQGRLMQAVAQWGMTKECVPASEIAYILRDVVGNPFQSILRKCNNGCRVMTSGKGDKPHHCYTHHKDVVYVGYDKRTRYAVCPDSLEYFRFTHCTPTVLAIAQSAYDERPGRKCERCNNPLSPQPCPDCYGTGRIDDGSLDPVTLAVLADALEDTGMPMEEECDLCNGDGYIDVRMTGPLMKCGKCNETGKLPHPILTHLRSPGAHVRGCWALDLILGKE